MLKKILLTIIILLVVLIGVLLFNTFRAKPWPARTVDSGQMPLPDSAIQHFSQAIQIPTVSISDSTGFDTTAFTAFNSFIEKTYPLIHQHLTKTVINGFAFVFEWKGQNASLLPFILMGHYDVVPVETATLNQWKVPPFSGAITDTCVWGRGSTDDKGTVISILEAAEALLKKGFTPQRTIYFCFGHDEETRGQGARAIAAYLEQKKVKAEMVLDEGGEVSTERLKEVTRPVAVIGVAEKGYASFELTVNKEGGHSSLPQKETAIDILANAIHKLRNKPTASIITPQLNEFLHRIGPSSDNFLNKMAVSNMWFFKGIMKKKLEATIEGYAMSHTVIVPTIIEAGVKDNVIPAIAKAIVNTRIITGETTESVEKFIRDAIDDDRVQVKRLGKFSTDPSTVTNIHSPAFKRVEDAIYRIVPHVLPTPYQMVGATDSRYYRNISDGVVNFFPATDSKGFHGINERLPIRDLQRGINFFTIIISESGKQF